MLFSVIIPAYNRLAYLPLAIGSVRAQQFTDCEIIVVDDGSTDGLHEYVEGLGSAVRLIRQANQGPGAARNRGAEHAAGEYLAFLDSDDFWFPWTLAVYARLIENHRGPGILAGSLAPFGINSELSAFEETLVEADVFRDYFAAASSGFFVGAGMVVLRRASFLKTGGFIRQRINAEDHDLILRMGTEPGFVQVRQPVTVGWRRHEGSATMNLRPTFEGMLHLIWQERRGVYPGGAARGRERRDIILRHVRPAALECLRHGMIGEAWSLYLDTFAWQAALGRWKFLSAFPAMAVVAGVRGIGR